MRGGYTDDSVATELRRVQKAAELRAQAEAHVPGNGADGLLSRVEGAATIADPRVFEVWRTGILGRLEYVGKRMRGATTELTSWRQARFNRAVIALLRDMAELLSAESRWMAHMQAAHRAELDDLRAVQHELRSELDDLRERLP